MPTAIQLKNAAFEKHMIRKQERLILIVISFLLLVLITTLSILFISANYGLDYTDEGYYLNWIAAPSMYKTSLTQFGFVYHALYLLVQGKISVLRQSNMLLTFSLATILCMLLLKNIVPQNRRLIPLSMLMASSSLIYFYVFGWLPTPSYNSLTLQALIVTSIGIILAEKNYSTSSILGWIIIGCGGWLLFMAKPSSAALLTLVLFLYCIVSKKFSVRLLTLSLVTCSILLLISAWAIDGSILLFIQRYQIAYNELAQLASLHLPLFRLGILEVDYKQYALLFLTTFILLVSNILVSLQHLRPTPTTFLRGCSQDSIAPCEQHRKQFVGTKLSICAFLITLLFILSTYGYMLHKINQLQIYKLGAIQLWSVPISALLSFLILMPFKSYTNKNVWALFCVFIAIPYIAAFGTTNNYWVQSQMASFFWVAAGVVLLIPIMRHFNKFIILLPTLIVTQFLSLFLILYSIHFPYRQTNPIYQNTQPTTIGAKHSQLNLNKDIADFFNTMQQVMVKIGLKPETEIIDMTGKSPGLINALGLKALGQAWLLGSYPGSDLFAETSLKRIPHSTLSRAWILVEPASTRQISLSILKNLDINLDKDYYVAAKLTLPNEMGGDSSVNQRKVVLYAPITQQ